MSRDWQIPGTDFKLTNVHAENARCRMAGCIIHNPDKDSVMNVEAWPYVWRSDTGIMERRCPHGIGHPDVNAARFHEANGDVDLLVHGCDGCCCREVETND